MQKAHRRSQKGCLTCRKRRKKCDETKPRCAQCLRLRLSCMWVDNTASSSNSDLTLEATGQTVTVETVYSPVDSISTSQRVADHDGLDREALEIDGGVFEVLTKRAQPFGMSTFTKSEELRHILITGIFQGWDSVAQMIRDDDLWSIMISFDQQTQRVGHGLVARLALALMAMAMHQHLATPEMNPEQLITTLPVWFLPKDTNARQGLESVVNFPIWPAVRDKFAAEPSRYLNDRFANTLNSQGVRFVWPYNSNLAVTTSPETGYFCFTDEFSLRVNNLRSFAMTADFLNKYPEFLGDAAQLEPSLTFYNPPCVEHLETLYWKILRERARQGRSHEKVLMPMQMVHAPATTGLEY